MKQKKGLIILIAILAIILLALGGYNMYRFPAMFRSLSDQSLKNTQVNELRKEIINKSDKKILVAYFSYSGTTKNIATTISEKTGGDLFEIKTQKDYVDVYKESNREIRTNAKPVLKNIVENMEEYDIVFVGYPVWWHATPAPVNTFLESYDLTGKLIIPFCTSGESGIEETMPTFLNSCEGLAVYGESRISGTEQIDEWITELGFRIAEQEEEKKSDNAEAVSDEELKEETVSGNDKKSLVVYFSWSGNTREMASYISEQTHGDLLEIEPVRPYPKDYEECGDVAKTERDENSRPEIANLPDTIKEYDTIFIGYPIWWHTAPMIIGTFLENYDLTGVEVYPFTQSASMDEKQFENSMEFVKKNANGANVHDGLFASYSDTDAIQEYLRTNNITDK